MDHPSSCLYLHQCCVNIVIDRHDSRLSDIDAARRQQRRLWQATVVCFDIVGLVFVMYRVSFVLSRYIMDATKDPWVIFYIFIFFQTIFLTLVTKLEIPPAVSPVLDDEASILSARSNIVESPVTEDTYLVQRHDAPKLTLFGSILKPKPILFFTTIALIGIVFQAIGSYLFIYLTQTWHVSQTLLG